MEQRISKLLYLQKRVCVNSDCKQTYSNCKRKCDTCGSAVRKPESDPIMKLQQTSSTQEKYINLGEKASINLTPMKLGEPILLKPEQLLKPGKYLE